MKIKLLILFLAIGSLGTKKIYAWPGMVSSNCELTYSDIKFLLLEASSKDDGTTVKGINCNFTITGRVQQYKVEFINVINGYASDGIKGFIPIASTDDVNAIEENFKNWSTKMLPECTEVTAWANSYFKNGVFVWEDYVALVMNVKVLCLNGIPMFKLTGVHGGCANLIRCLLKKVVPPPPPPPCPDVYTPDCKGNSLLRGTKTDSGYYYGNGQYWLSDKGVWWYKTKTGAFAELCPCPAPNIIVYQPEYVCDNKVTTTDGVNYYDSRNNVWMRKSPYGWTWPNGDRVVCGEDHQQSNIQIVLAFITGGGQARNSQRRHGRNVIHDQPFDGGNTVQDQPFDGGSGRNGNVREVISRGNNGGNNQNQNNNGNKNVPHNTNGGGRQNGVNQTLHRH